MAGTAWVPVERLIEILGPAGALKVAERFGGRRLYLPQPERLKPESALVQLIGMEAANRLAFEWRGVDVMIPKCAALVRAARDQAIRADSRALSVRDLAEKYDTTERHVTRILAAEPADIPVAAAAAAGQRDLFKG